MVRFMMMLMALLVIMVFMIVMIMVFMIVIIIMFMIVMVIIMVVMMTVALKVVMVHAEVVDKVPGEGVVTVPGPGDQVLVLSQDAHQPLQPKARQTHQEVSALLFNDTLAHVVISIKYPGEVSLARIVEH